MQYSNFQQKKSLLEKRYSNSKRVGRPARFSTKSDSRREKHGLAIITTINITVTNMVIQTITGRVRVVGYGVFRRGPRSGPN